MVPTHTFSAHSRLRQAARFAVLLAAVFAPAAHATSFYLVTTNMQGAQTQIDNFHTSSWLFGTGNEWDLGGGVFFMKDGSASQGATYLTLKSEGVFLSQVMLTQENFNTQNSSSQSFSPVSYLFPTAIHLEANKTYTLALTGPGIPDQQSDAYFIKGYDTASFYADPDPASQNPIPAGNLAATVQSTVADTSTPEPSSWILIGLGAGLLLLRRRKAA